MDEDKLIGINKFRLGLFKRDLQAYMDATYASGYSSAKNDFDEVDRAKRRRERAQEKLVDNVIRWLLEAQEDSK